MVTDNRNPLIEPLRPTHQLAFSGSGKGRWEVPEGFGEVVPRFRWEDLRLPTIPRPPPIPRGAIRNEHARHCAAWLAAWVEVNFGERPKYGAKTQYEQRRNWRSIHDGIECLQKHGVPAAQWVQYYAWIWKESGQLNPPAFSRVFSRGVIAGDAAKDLSGHVRNAKTRTLGGRVIGLPRAKRLARVHSCMMSELMLRRPSTIDGVRAIVAAHFPGERFRLEVACLVAEGEAERVRLGKMIARTTWIW